MREMPLGQKMKRRWPKASVGPVWTLMERPAMGVMVHSCHPAPRNLRQEFEARLGYIARPYLKNKNTLSLLDSDVSSKSQAELDWEMKQVQRLSPGCPGRVRTNQLHPGSLS
jgi:hypothetical protein